MNRIIPYFIVPTGIEPPQMAQEIKEGCVPKAFGINPKLGANILFASGAGFIYVIPNPLPPGFNLEEPPHLTTINGANYCNGESKLETTLKADKPIFAFVPLSYEARLSSLLSKMGFSTRKEGKRVYEFPQHTHLRCDIG